MRDFKNWRKFFLSSQTCVNFSPVLKSFIITESYSRCVEQFLLGEKDNEGLGKKMRMKWKLDAEGEGRNEAAEEGRGQ